MAELDTLSVFNPLGETFNVRFNGELYSIPSKEAKHFPQFLAFHIAKHLSDKLLSPDVQKLQKTKSEDPYDPRVGQVLVYDNPKRRMTLFDILGSKDSVQQCVAAFPFKAFIGEMSDYDEYVEKKLGKKEKE